MQTIFIQIAAYRDDELPKTIASCLANAAHPERLTFGIVHQYGPETQTLIDDYKHRDNFKVIELPWHEARGVGRARYWCNSLYASEDFALQIDSHMRFEDRWDERLIAEWRQCNNPKAILSSYPPAFRYDDNEEELFIVSDPNRLVVHEFFMGDIPIFFGKAIPGKPSTPVRGAFSAGGLQFAPGAICEQVPYDKEICFIGEEIVHSLRLFTHGYAIYSPIDQVIHHLYTRSKHQKNAHHFWNDFSENPKQKAIYDQMTNTSYVRVRSILSGVIQEGLGNEATLYDFENFAGVDFSAKKVHKDTYEMPPLPMTNDDAWRVDAIDAVKQT